jgi:hypothetical protein
MSVDETPRLVWEWTPAHAAMTAAAVNEDIRKAIEAHTNAGTRVSVVSRAVGVDVRGRPVQVPIQVYAEPR